MTTTHPGSAHTSLREWATGVTVFAAIMLMIGGILDVMRGIAEIADDDIFVSTRNYVFEFNLTAWGWIHLALGVLAFVVSFGLFMAATWARVLGVGIAGLVIISNFLSLPSYPAWSIIMIAISGFIVWALCVMRKDDAFVPFESPRGA
ncbi:hypothetical protein OR263_37755 [Streptomyces sp. NEAU-H22]|uniref:DUF7144 family membrane protein n=1 Tax=Streptomyces sp. NEAU-H22 TaxID=2994655 RepID=UPI002258E37B|nr:hypothetical protein [Streptomyces sp. NEAU-H22]MCX3292380.1 hypothetical protein [Streptomyces sp. NEAU-H22]